MSFHSTLFLFLFLPAVLAGYYLAGRKSAAWARAFLLGMSFVFYGYCSIGFLMLLIADILAGYFLASRYAGGRHKPVFVAAIVLNIGLLGYCKYTNFFLEEIGRLFHTDVPFLSIALPLGISFYTFSQIALAVQIYRGSLALPPLQDYALYVAYFPKLVQGPVTDPADFLRQATDKNCARWDDTRFVRGMQMFAAGLAKKVILADLLGAAVDYGIEYARLLFTGDLIILMLAYTFQIYFDFSGYSDMAAGVSEMLGIRLPMNFDSPYRAFSVTDFWRRWHMSLTSFLREYIYIPLGGSRKGRLRTYCNILIVFLVSGLWHGAAWSYVLWGLWHGLWQVFERIFRKPLAYVPKAVRWLCTFVIVNIGWLLFRTEDLHLCVDVILDTIADWDFKPLNPQFAEYLRIPGLRMLMKAIHMPYSEEVVFAASAVVILSLSMILSVAPRNIYRREYRATKGSLILTAVLLMAGILCMGSVSTFIYANF